MSLTNRMVSRLSALTSRVAVDPVVRAIAIETYIRDELEAVRLAQPGNPILDGFKVFSQVDEDGIIESIAKRLPETARSRTFIEIGCGRGVENNTAYLVLKGYRGVWVDGSERNIGFILNRVPNARNSKILRVEENMVFAANIGDLLRGHCDHIGTKEPEFFSLDIDGNDVFVLEEAMKVIRPAFLCVEYNGKFPASLNMTIRRNDEHMWQSDDYHGATLASFVQALPGYRLVSCSMAGTNAFFVREEFAAAFPEYTVEQLYRPARYELVKRSAGHAPSLNWIRDAIGAA